MNPVVWHLVYCQYCTLDFTDKSRAAVEASRNAHEKVCHKNPDVMADAKSDESK